MRRRLLAPLIALFVVCALPALAISNAAYLILFSGVLPAVQTNFLTQPSLPSWLTFSRASNAGMFDSTGAFTYAPNNQVTYSQDLTQWTLSTSGVGSPAVRTFNYTTGPSGQPVTRLQLALNGGTASGDISRVLMNETFPSAGGQIILSFWAKLNTGTSAVIGIQQTQTTSQGSGFTVTNSWAQYYAVKTINGTSTPQFAIGLRGAQTPTQSDSVDLLITDVQSEFVTYETTPRAQNYTSGSVYYGPRFDNTPAVANSPLGLLIEEARTNSLRNSMMVGAVAGSPGTIPTNWVSSGTAGTTQTLAVGTEYGMPYLDWRLNGTTSTTSVTLYFEAQAQIAAAQNQVWTNSFYQRMVAGSQTNITAIQSSIRENNDAGTLQSIGNTTISVSSTFARSSSTRTLVSAGTTKVTSGVTIAFSSGVAIDITLRIYAPQLELGAFATSFIPTYSAALTRAAEVAYGTFPQLNASSGAAIVEVAFVSSAASTVLAESGAGTSFSLLTSTVSTRLRNVVRQGSSRADYNDATNPTIVNGTPIRSGVSWGTPASAMNGSASVLTATPAQSDGANPLVIYLGSRSGTSIWSNIWLRSIGTYSTALPQSALNAKSVVGAPY
jgi:hypothetical protein